MDVIVREYPRRRHHPHEGGGTPRSGASSLVQKLSDVLFLTSSITA